MIAKDTPPDEPISLDGMIIFDNFEAGEPVVVDTMGSSMEGERYVEGLSDDDVAALEKALNSSTLLDIRNNSLSPDVQAAINAVDRIILGAPTTDFDITIYKTMRDMPELRAGGELYEPAYLIGTTERPSQFTIDDESGAILDITIPKGSHILQLPEGVIVCHKAVSLDLEPSKTALVKAVVIENEEGGLHAGKTHR